MRRERDRYGRASLAERVGDVLGWFRAHPLALVPILIVGAGIVTQLVAPPRSALPNDLAVGDCLFIRTSAANAIGPGARPIGESPEAADVLMRGGAEQVDCLSSHGHEVSAVLDLREHEYTPTEASAACDAALEPYVGRQPTRSRYVTFAALPTSAAPAGGPQVGICLVARADGEWMDHPARGGRE